MVSYINLDEEREAEVESCFSCNVDFHYLKSFKQFEDLLEVFKVRSKTAKKNDDDNDTSLSDNEFFHEGDGFGEKKTCKQLIVMVDVSGLTGK